MSTTVRAIYEDGVIKPKEKLPLVDHTEVLILILPIEGQPVRKPDADRLSVLREEVATWLVQQPAEAVREPVATSSSADLDFERALAAIRRRASQHSLAQIRADVEAAIAEARSLSPKERQELDSELTQLLAQWAVDAVS